MKLFTEKDVTEMILKTRKFGFTAEYLIISTQGIELPSDEEIEREAELSFGGNDRNKSVWVNACKWYREQLKQK